MIPEEEPGRGRPRRWQERRLLGKPQAWPGEARVEDTGEEGQTDRSEFAGFLGHRREGRSAANLGVESPSWGCGEATTGSEGTGWEEWICGFKSVAEAWCVVTTWMRTLCLSFPGLWGFAPTGTSIQLQKAVVVNLFLAGFRSLPCVHTSVLQRCLYSLSSF